MRGVEAGRVEQQSTIRAELVVGADGRHSTTRERGKLELKNLGAPMDVLWFPLTSKDGDPGRPLGVFDPGRVLVMIKRDRPRRPPRNA